MSIMIEEEMNNSSLIAALKPSLTPDPSKNPPLLPLPVPTPVPNIAAAAMGMLSDALLDLSTKFQLNSILNRN